MSGMGPLDGVLVALSIIPLASEFLSSGPSDSVRVSIGAGSPATGAVDPGMGGAVPVVTLFDNNGIPIGRKKSTNFDLLNVDNMQKVGIGNKLDIDVPQNFEHRGGSAQPEYLSLSAVDGDALCISFIYVSIPSGGPKYVWYGDSGLSCGAEHGFHWYESHTMVGSYEEDKPYYPRCTWIDADGTGGVLTKGIGIHLESFVPTPERVVSYARDRKRLCNSPPRFHAYPEFDPNHPIWYFAQQPRYDANQVDMNASTIIADPKYWAQTKIVRYAGDSDQYVGLNVKRRGRRGERDAAAARPDARPSSPSSSSSSSPPPSRRPPHSGPRKRWPNPDHLVSSTIESHSARALCESPSSWGRDFVAHKEGLFCDMQRRALHRICASDADSGCFDTGTNMMRLGKGNSKRDESGTPIVQKRYTHVEHW
jgi:hypothetical protein